MADRWACGECGEKNILERVNCYSCLAFKPGPRTPPGPEPQTPPELLLSQPSNGVPRKKTWSCKSCYAVNSSKTSECYLCNSLRPSKAPAPSGSPDEWCCRFCRTPNLLKRESCLTCNALRESTVTTTTSTSTPSEPDVDYWTCTNCSYKASHGPYCFQCGFGKTSSAKPCPENWKCSKCSIENFAKRTQCYSCHKKRKKRSPSPQPVTCPTCKFCNEPSSKECLLCGSPLPTLHTRPTPHQKRRMLKTSSSSGSAPPSKNCLTSPSSVTIPNNCFVTPEDWKCQSCDYKNIALRNFCKDCDTPRKCIAKLYIKYKKYGISALLNARHNQDSTSASAPPVTPKQAVSSRACSKCTRPYDGPPGTVCHDCSFKIGVRSDPPSSSEPSHSSSVSTNSQVESVISKKCAKCGTECDGQYCYECAHKLGIRQERDTWECQNCHLVDENTAICMGCGHNKAESKIVATKFLSCSHCHTKNHAHKTNCVRCLKVLHPKQVPSSSGGNDNRPSTPDTWTCRFCEISVLAKSTHCRGCCRPRSRAAKAGPGNDKELPPNSTPARETQQEPVMEEDAEEGEYVEPETEDHQTTDPLYNQEQEYTGEGAEEGEYDEFNEEESEYYEEEYYEPRHYLPPPPPRLRARYPPAGPPRAPPAGPPRFPPHRYPGQHHMRPPRPRNPSHMRLRSPQNQLPRTRPPKKILLPRRQPMNLMLPNHGL